MITSAVNKQQHKKTHKFGIRIPRNSHKAHIIDKENVKNLWSDAMAKEMRNVQVVFRIINNGQTAPVGYQFLWCHEIWDVILDSFKRKFRLVAGGHMNKAPASITYASVVSRDSVRI